MVTKVPEVKGIINDIAEELMFRKYECDRLIEKLQLIRKDFNVQVDSYRNQMNREIDTFCEVIERKRTRYDNNALTLRKANGIIFDDHKKKTWRDNVLMRDRCICKKCGSVENLTVHHLVPKSVCGENLMWDENNGITLCKDCHEEWHEKYDLNDGIGIFMKWLKGIL